MRRKSVKYRILAACLAASMVFTMMPMTAFAEEINVDPTGMEMQTESLNEEVNAEENIPEEETGDTTQTKAEQDLETEAAAEERNADTVSERKMQEQTSGSEAIEALQSRINALPTVDEFVAMADGTTVEDSTLNQAQLDVYNETQAIAEEMDKLTDEEQGPLDTGKLEELFEYFNGMTAETALTPGATVTLTSSSQYITQAGTYNIKASSGISTSKNVLIINNTSASDNIVINIQGNITISDSSAIIKVDSPCNLTINGNGYTVKNSGSSNTFMSEVASNVTVTGGVFENVVGTPTFINIGGGTLTFSNVTINGYIRNSNAKSILNIKDGTIINVPSGAAYGIYSGIVRMTGGTINGSGTYGAIHSRASYDDIEITGGTITGCDKAVYLYSGSSGNIKIGGNVVFSNNTTDVYLTANQTFSINEDYAGKISVGVADTVSANSKRQITKSQSTDYQKNLNVVSVNSSYAVNYDASGKYLYLWKHSHTWNYSASGDTITAKCTSDSKCEYYSEGLTATLTAPDMTYTGSAYNKASVTNNITSVTGTSADSIRYYNSQNQEMSTPVTAGTYTAKVKIGGATATADFEITKADITPAVSLTDWVYGSTASTPKVTGNSGNGTVTYSYKEQDADDSTYTEVTDFSTIPVGSYTLKASIAESTNYNAKEATCNFAVTKQPITVEVSMAGWTYGDTANTPNITDGSNPGSGNVIYTYYTDAGCINQTTSADGAAIDGAAPKNAGTYYVKATVAETENYETGSDSAEFTIVKKAVIATVTAENKIYDGKVEATVNAVVADSDLIPGDKIEIQGITGTFADQNAGTDKKVTVDSSKAEYAGTGVENYDITIGTETTASISRRTVEFAWSNTALTYTGSEQSVTAEVSNAVSGDTFILTYDGNKQTAVGEYTAKVTTLGNDNYALPEGDKAQTAWKISYLAKGTATVSGTKGDNDWYVTKVTITPESGYLISTDGREWQSFLAYDAQGEQTVTYHLMEKETGFITEEKSESFKIDTELPTGEILVKDNGFTELLNTITFKYFFKKTVDVKITGADVTSGIAKIEYQKVAKGAAFDKDGIWTEGKSFSMTANDKSAIYARITDHAGNFAIINSDGIVVYTDATATAEETFTKTSTEDVTTGINVNGNTIASVKNGDTTVAESAYEIKEGRLVLKASYLQTLAAGEYTFTVSYHPYGEAYTADSKGEAPDTSVITLQVIGEMKVSVEGYAGTYDGQAHGIKVSVTDPADASAYHVKVTYGVKAEDGTITYSENPVTYKDAGEYTVYIKATADYYKDVVESAVVKIAPKTVSLVWSDTEFTYDGQAHKPAAEVNSKDLIGSDSAEVTVSGEQTNAGSYTAQAVALSNGNYVLGTDVNKVFVIKKAEAAVTVDDAIKHIGKADPEFTYQVTGLVEGEALADITVVRTEGEAAGEYDITATAKDGSNANYDVTFTAGKLTIEDHIKAEAPVVENRVEATCTEDGSYDEVYYCTVEECKAELERVHQIIPAIGHAYGEAVFTWSEDYGAAQAAFTCANNKNHVETVEAAVTTEIVAPTCETAGKTIYTATAEFAGKTYTDTKETAIPATGHKYGEPVFTWSEDYSSASAAFTCANDADHVETETCEVTSQKTEPTCTETGKIVYTAVCYFAGNEQDEEEIYTDTKEVILEAIGHAYGEPVFTWSEDYSSATAAFTCANDASHVEIKECTVEKEITKQASGTEKGEITYTATVTLDGKMYVDTKAQETEIVGSEEIGANGGKITTEIIVAEDMPKTEIKNLTVETARELLTTEELAQVEAGAEITIYLEANSLTEDAVKVEDKAYVEDKLDGILEQLLQSEGLTSKKQLTTGIQYIDLSLYKKIGNGTATKLKSTGQNELEITVDIPENLKSDNSKRTYYIIRVHETDAGTEVDILPATRTGDSLTFKTDRFSTYAIAYAEPNGYIVPVKVTLNQTEVTLTSKGSTTQLTATVEPENAANKNVTWTSSDPNVATVDANGLVTAVADGTATITVTTEEGGATATATITVKIPSEDDEDDDGNKDSGNTTNDPTTTPDDNRSFTSPKTGDSAAVWITLFFVSCAGLAGLLIKRKKEDCR